MSTNASAEHRSRSMRERLRVLIADNHAGTQQALSLLLRWFGCRADLADDGREALEAFRGRDYDLILMDVVMPRMDGLEATRQIRREQSCPGGPRIVGISTDSTPEDRQIGLDAGMDDFLGKPIDIEALVRILDEVAEGVVAVAR